MKKGKRFRKSAIIIVLLFILIIPSCSKKIDLVDNYRTYYEICLYSFCDSNNDGIGDINGLISKLDYLNDNNTKTTDDLGITGIWLTPITQGTSYHKYDVEDYYSIDKQFGTIEDFKKLVEECHKRNIKLIIDMVVNHSSVKNPWFISAKKSMNIEPCGKDICVEEDLCKEHNPYCSYYNFSTESKSDYHRINDNLYYEGVFWSGMPDLNLDSDKLKKEFENIFDFWLDLGVDGFRFDAVKHFYTGQTKKNVEFLNFCADYIKSKNKDSYLVGEAWSDISEIASYYESHFDSFFNFSYATEDGLIAKMLNSKDNKYTGDYYSKKLEDNQKLFLSKNPNAIEAPFSGNHDSGRIAGILMSKPERIKMQIAMLSTMSGNIFIYYGDEVGLKGSGKDENKRAPMPWSESDNTNKTNPVPNMDSISQMFEPVDKQQEDEDSILNFYKKAINLRNKYPIISHGLIESVHISDESKISCIKKTYNEKEIYLIYNFSSEDNFTLDLSNTVLNDTKLKDSLNALGLESKQDGKVIEIAPYSVLVLE